jgi:hypothetical protein
VEHNAVRSESRGFVRGEKLLWDRRRPIADRYRSYFDLVVAADWYVSPSSQMRIRELLSFVVITSVYR